MSDRQKGTTKAGGQKHALDKFYTKPEVANDCIQQLDLSEFTEIIEPSAGSGAFSNQIPGIKAYDLEPEHPSIEKQDWFEYQRDRSDKDKILVIGNPPFGQQNTLAIRFINHAAVFADVIAFILPRSFMKASVQDRINSHFHLERNVVLPENSFELDGKDMSVPCVFQVWRYHVDTRVKTLQLSAKGFKFVKKDNEPDFYVQRVGGNAGSIGWNWEERSEQSNYFVKAETTTDVADLFTNFSNLVIAEREYSVGPRSISKQELLKGLLLAAPQYVNSVSK